MPTTLKKKNKVKTKSPKLKGKKTVTKSTKKGKAGKPLSRIERIKKQLAGMNSGGGSNMFYFKEGVVRMRAVRIREEEDLGLEVIRFYLGPKDSFISPMSIGLPCAVYDKWEELRSSSDESDRELATKMGYGKRIVMAFYRFSDEKGKQVDSDAGVRLAMLANSQYTEICEMFMDEEKGDMTDPVEGYDIKFKRVGKGMKDTRYTMIDCKQTKMAKEFAKKVYNKEEMIAKIIPTFEETEQHLENILGKLSDSDLKPKKKGKKKKNKKGDL